jgi:hypothetical protein
MGKGMIYIILVLCGGAIAYVMLGGLFTNELQTSRKNPYQYEVGDIRHIDPALIKYKEAKRIALSFAGPKSLDYHLGMLAIGYKNHLQLIDTLGYEVFQVMVEGPVTALAFGRNEILFVASKNHIRKYDMAGNELEKWHDLDSGAFITSLAADGRFVYVANAGGPEVLRYNLNGELQNSFDGKNRTDQKHGFVIPSPYFDVDIDSEGQLWVANTGLQAIENYKTDGSLRSHWGSSTYDLQGFIGCCNPAHFTILPNDSFVTCEKGLIRIKVYLPSGELESVVATPADFDQGAEAPDLSADETGHIYMLDINRSMIRKFERKEST